MEYKIKELIYSFFRSVPDCAQMRALRTELTRNMIRRYYNYISSGKTPGEAYDAILGCAQEIKDRIADAMRNVRAAHAAPPFGGTGRTTRRYSAHSQSTGTGTQQQQDTAEKGPPQKAKNNACSHSGKAQADKSAKKAVSISAAFAVALAGAALTALAACGVFFITQTAFFNSRMDSGIETPISAAGSTDSPETDAGKTHADSGTVLDFGDAAQGYRDMVQSFSEDGAYAVEAAHLTEVDMLEVNWPAGNVQVHVYDGTDFLVLENAQDGVTQQQALCCGLEGNTLFVQYCTPQAAQAALPVKDLEICIPRALADAAVNADFVIGDAALTLNGITFSTMQIDAKDGCITADHLNITGPLNIETVSADASFSGLFENVTFSSESGSVQIDSGDVLCSIEARTQSGNVNVNANIHRLKASTYDGDVRIQAPICPYALDITTQTGGVALHLPVQSDFTLDFYSNSGDLISGLSVVDAHGAYVRGDGIAGFHIETVSGDLQIFAYTPAS